MLLYFPMVIAVFMTVTRDLLSALQINYFDWQTHISPGLCPVIVLHPLSQRPLADRGGQAPRGAAGFRVLWALFAHGSKTSLFWQQVAANYVAG